MLREMELKLSSDSPMLLQNPNAIGNAKRQSVFVIAAMSGDIELVRYWMIEKQDAVRRYTPVTQDNINEAFKAAVVRGHLNIVECLLPRISTLKYECSARAGSGLTLAASLGKPDIVKAICGHRINVFVTETTKQSSLNRYGIYAPLNEADILAGELEAANALWKLLNGKTTYDEVVSQFAAVRLGELAVILSLIKKYYLDYQPKLPVNEAASGAAPVKTADPGCMTLMCRIL